MKYLSIFLLTGILAVGTTTVIAGGKNCQATAAAKLAADTDGKGTACPPSECASKASTASAESGNCPVTGATASDMKNCPPGSCDKAHASLTKAPSAATDATPAATTSPTVAPAETKAANAPGCCGSKAKSANIESTPASPETMKKAS